MKSTAIPDERALRIVERLDVIAQKSDRERHRVAAFWQRVATTTDHATLIEAERRVRIAMRTLGDDQGDAACALWNQFDRICRVLKKRAVTALEREDQPVLRLVK